MSTEELIEKILLEKFKESNDMNKIIEFIRSCKEKLIIKKTEISTEDLIAYLQRRKDIDLGVKLDGNEVEFKYDADYFIKAVIRNLSPTLKELTLPSSFLDSNIHLVDRLNSLTKLTLADYGFLNPEQLNYLKEHTNIKELEFTSAYIFNNGYDDLVTIKKDGKTMGYCKDITIRQAKSQKNDTDEEFKSEVSKDIEVTARTITKEDIERIFDMIGEDLTTTNRQIEINGDNQRYRFSINDGIVNVDINAPDMDIACDIYESFSKRGLNVNGMFLKETPGYADKDFSKLDKLGKKVEIRIRYRDTSETSTYEDFRALSETMKWYRSIINDYPLSPVEKLAFAYDILKTFKYNETDKKDIMESRDPFKIVKTGHIVCSGYTAMLKEIFDEFDPNIKIGSFSVTCFDEDDKTVLGDHSRSIAIVDDDKYGIHGAYALDPTWDSYKEQGQEQLGEGYTALDLYRYFMVPFSEYKNVFKHDSDINFFGGKYSYLNANLNDENINKAVRTIERQNTQEEGELPFSTLDPTLNYEIKKIIPNKSDQEVIELFKAKRIPPTTLMQIVRNVRLAEGYKDEIDEEMAKVSGIYDQLNPQIDQLTGKML